MGFDLDGLFSVTKNGVCFFRINSPLSRAEPRHVSLPKENQTQGQAYVSKLILCYLSDNFPKLLTTK